MSNLITLPIDTDEWHANSKAFGKHDVDITADGDTVTGTQSMVNPMEGIYNAAIELRPGMYWAPATPLVANEGDIFTLTTEWAQAPQTGQRGLVVAIVAYWPAGNEWDVLARVDYGHTTDPVGDPFDGTGGADEYEPLVVGPSDPAPDGAHIRILVSVNVSQSPNTKWAPISLRAPLLEAGAAPDPDPDPDPDALIDELAPKVAAYIGRAGDQRAIETAKGQLPIVVEFVNGYVRGNGMNEDEQTGDYSPTRALRAVIVAACSRLVLNPQQLRQYSTVDYSATPAVLNGYTLAEIGILHRYRKRSQ